MSRAPSSYAISRATSSLVPTEATSMPASPSRARRSLPGALSVGIGVDHQLGAGAKSLVADAVHVAHDDVGAKAQLDQGVGAAVDPDGHRAHLVDVRSDGPQVLAVARSPHHDQGGPARKLRTSSCGKRTAPRMKSFSLRAYSSVFSTKASISVATFSRAVGVSLRPRHSRVSSLPSRDERAVPVDAPVLHLHHSRRPRATRKPRRPRRPRPGFPPRAGCGGRDWGSVR